MACTAGAGLPREKGIVVALTHIYGIGEPTVKKICAGAGVSGDIRPKDLTPEDQEKLRAEVDKYRVKGDLCCEISTNIKRLVDIGSYRGVRHRYGLPVCGQSTRNNARTRKGSERNC